MSPIPPTRRKKTPVRLYLPPNLKLTELSKALTGTENSYSLVKKVCILYTYLISKGFDPEKENDFGAGWTQVKATVMKAIFGRMYFTVVGFLLNKGYLDRLEVDLQTGEEKLEGWYRMPGHREGSQAKQYRIPEWMLDSKGKKFVVAMEPMGKADLNKAAGIRAPKRHYAQDASRRHVEEMMRSVVMVNTPDCRAVIRGLWEQEAVQMQPEEFLEVFNHGALNEIIVDEFGQRVHSQLTRHSKKLRPFLRFADDLDAPLVEIDIVSSQPAILASITPALIERFAPECERAAPIFEALQHAFGFRKYQDICFYEDIYAYLARKWNEQYPKLPKTREDAKQIFLVAAYSDYSFLDGLNRKNLESKVRWREVRNPFSSNDKEVEDKAYKNLVSLLSYELFKTEFKALHEAFAALKQLDWSAFNPSRKGPYTNNCLLAQRIESGIVYGSWVPTLLGAGIKKLYTIHDAVVVREADEAHAREIIQGEIQKLGLKLKLNV